MEEKTRQKLLKEKVLYLMNIQQRIEVLEQKIDNNIISDQEKIEIKGLYNLKYKTKKEIDSLYEQGINNL